MRLPYRAARYAHCARSENVSELKRSSASRGGTGANFLFTIIQFSEIPTIKQTHPWINDRTISKLYEEKLMHAELID